jgi:hypothetical protein
LPFSLLASGIFHAFNSKSMSENLAFDNSPILHRVDKAIQIAHSVDFNKPASGNCRANALISSSFNTLLRSVGFVVVWAMLRLAVGSKSITSLFTANLNICRISFRMFRAK